MILVTGSTGLVGSHLLYHLINNGESVRAIYRSKNKIKNVKRVFQYYTDNTEKLFNKIEWIQADITDVPALEVAFKNIDYVYHCAANLSFNKADYHLSKETNVTGTSNIVNLCLSNSVKKLCHVSSIATLGENLNSPITEDTNWNPENNKHNIYAITKYNAELEVWRGTQEGLDAVIVNPGVIIGPGFWNESTGEIFTKIDHGFNYFTKGSVGIIAVNDVVKAMISLQENRVKNEKFILVSDNITYEKFIQYISNALNKKNNLKSLKKWQLILYYQVEKIKYLFLKGSPSLNKSNINSAFKNLSYDISKIKNTIPVKFTPIKESIQNIAKLYQTDKK